MRANTWHYKRSHTVPAHKKKLRLASEWCSVERNPPDPPLEQCYKSIHQLIKQTLCPDIRNAEVIPRALCQCIAIAIITAFPYDLGGSGRRVECLFHLFPSVNMWHIQIKCPPVSLIVFCWRFLPPSATAPRSNCWPLLLRSLFPADSGRCGEDRRPLSRFTNFRNAWN